MTRSPDAATGPTRTLRIDTHVHTAASYDGRTRPAELLERAETLGLDGVVVTDHDTVTGALDVAELAPEYDVVAIVGCEVSTADGHLLAIGVEAAPEPGRSLPETAREVRENGGIAVVPHPFQLSRHGARASAIAGVDGVEVYNAHALTCLRNAQAARFAAREGYPAFGGSDAHRVAGIGRAVTEVVLPETAPASRDTVLDAMGAGHTAATGRRSSVRQYLTKMAENATRKTSGVADPVTRS